MKFISASEVTKMKGIEHLVVHPKTGIIWVDRYRATANPKRLNRSLRTKSWPEAKYKRDVMIAEWLGEKLTNAPRQSLGELWPDFLELHKSLREQTYDSVKYAGQRFMPFFGNMFTYEIDDDQWDRYIIWRREQSHSRVKFANDAKWLGKFLKRLSARGLFINEKGEPKALPDLKNPDPKKRNAGKDIPDEDIKALFDHAGPDLALQIAMGFSMFMRLSEIMLLTWDRVDFKRRVIVLKEEHTKIKQARDVNMSNEVFLALKEKEKAAQGSALFPTPEDPNKTQSRQGNKRAWATCKRVAAVKCRFHDLRHAGLTRAFKKSNQWAHICIVAGLSLKEAQRTYIHIESKDTAFVAGLVGS